MLSLTFFEFQIQNAKIFLYDVNIRRYDAYQMDLVKLIVVCNLKVAPTMRYCNNVD